ncbi:hypothetical protein BT96DRAFT_938349 [Gymnopus androsaceus JB14]|uniref:Uncharacterized protein n=1 Tax=Gymnopus androsaceus JB14 TaxID=1447944 RepID=A0A6A4HPH0_9AGAR|nr:hypothetical protein BT96DRAFT_938349 [Gymnopus androsaceus JB14]
MNLRGAKVDLAAMGLKRYSQKERQAAKEQKEAAAREEKDMRKLQLNFRRQLAHKNASPRLKMIGLATKLNVNHCVPILICSGAIQNLQKCREHPKNRNQPLKAKSMVSTDLTVTKSSTSNLEQQKATELAPPNPESQEILVDFDMEASPEPDPLEMEEDADLHYEPLGPGRFFSPDDIDLPPTSTVDTESDFADRMDMDDEDENSDPDFMPSEDEGEAEDDDASNDAGLDPELAHAAALREFEAEWTKKRAQEKNAEKRKEAAERRKVASAVAQQRMEAPPNTIDIIPGSSSKPKKRPGPPNDEQGNIKRQKPTIPPKSKPDIGGLRADAQKTLLKRKAAASSNVSLVSSECGGGTSEGAAGDFDQDESVASLTAAREMKKKGPKAKSKSQAVNAVSLVPADVKIIDGKERRTQPKATRHTWSKSHLPLKSVEDIRKWDTQYMPHIYNFIGAQEAQFGTNSNLELKAFQAILWAEIFPALKEDANEPAITGVIQANLRTYRSEIGKKALKIVSRKAEEYDQECRADYIAGELDNDAWGYASPGLTRAESKGAMQGPGVLETLSLHLEFTQNVPHPDPPTGALALCAAAYLRALHAWQPGFNSIAETRRLAKEEKVQNGKGNVSKNNKDTGFSDEWAPTVSKYYSVLKKTPKTKWPTILDHARPFMNSKRRSAVTIKRETEDSEGMENGADDEFIMSD